MSEQTYRIKALEWRTSKGGEWKGCLYVDTVLGRYWILPEFSKNDPRPGFWLEDVGAPCWSLRGSIDECKRDVETAYRRCLLTALDPA